MTRLLRALASITIAALSLLTAREGRAQTVNYGNWSPYQYNDNIWKPMDTCRLQAQQRYPNWTNQDAEGRLRSSQSCLQSQNLPPVRPLGPSTWPPGPPVIEGGPSDH
jgi:hypothetical protein